MDDILWITFKEINGEKREENRFFFLSFLTLFYTEINNKSFKLLINYLWENKSKRKKLTKNRYKVNKLFRYYSFYKD